MKLRKRILSDKILPNSDYVKYISLIDKSDMENYLEFALTNKGLSEINSLFTDDKNDDSLHNRFPLILLNLYNEDIPLDGIKDITISGLEKSVKLKKLYVRDYLRQTFTSRLDCQSYKDINNIKVVMYNIYNEVLTGGERLLIRELMKKEGEDIIGDENKFYGNKFYNFLLRINGEEAECEKKIHVLSAILNYDMYETVPDFIPGSLGDIFSSGDAKNLLLSVFQKIMLRTINYTI